MTFGLQKIRRKLLTNWAVDDILLLCLSGGIGRHKGLKIPRPSGHAGSIPASSTILENVWLDNSMNSLGGALFLAHQSLVFLFTRGIFDESRTS